jgi:hypothetical protein
MLVPERPPVVGLEDDSGSARRMICVSSLRIRRVEIREAAQDRVAEDAERRGCERVEVTLQPERRAAKALYLSAGFEEHPLRLIRTLRPG